MTTGKNERHSLVMMTYKRSCMEKGLISLYPIIAQFTNIMIFDESSFTLIPPLLGGLAVTLVSATILFKKYRKQKDQEMILD